MNDAAIEPGAKPSAHGRSEILPAMNRLLTPAGNVRSDGDHGFPNAKYRVGEPNPGMEPPRRVSPLNRLFSSPSVPRRLAPILVLAQRGKGSPNAELHIGGPAPSLRGLGRVPKSGPEVSRRCGRSGEEPNEPKLGSFCMFGPADWVCLCNRLRTTGYRLLPNWLCVFQLMAGSNSS